MNNFYYTYPEIEENPELKKLLQECKSDEERNNLLIMNVIYLVIVFVIAVAICGVISLFIG